jgi:hypothetical protein
MSDDEFISLRLKIYQQIENKQWDDISFNDHTYSIYKGHHGYNSLFSEEIKSILLQNDNYNDDIERTVIRLFGSRQYLKEAIYYMNWNRLIYDVDKGYISVSELNGTNNSEPLFIYYTNNYFEDNIKQKTKFENMKFLIDKGANINIQDDDGNTLLHKFIYKYRSKNSYYEYLKFYANFIDFLLENGADPCLPNKKGKSSYDLVIEEVQTKNCKFISRDKITEIIKSVFIIDSQVRLCEIFYSLMLKYII